MNPKPPTRYAISDIHGCLMTLKYLVEEKIQLQKNDQLFVLGDMIDRGPDSKGVLDYLVQLKESGYRVRMLCGNHEEMMLECLQDSGECTMWLYNGGEETLASFGVDRVADIPPEYEVLLRNLENYIWLDDYLLVHAGVNFLAMDPLKDIYAMRWFRPGYPIDHGFLGSRRIVHGHTPQPLVSIKTYVDDTESTLIGIDAGCVYKDRLGMGYLVALNLETMELIETEYRG